MKNVAIAIGLTTDGAITSQKKWMMKVGVKNGKNPKMII